MASRHQLRWMAGELAISTCPSYQFTSPILNLPYCTVLFPYPALGLTVSSNATRLHAPSTGYWAARVKAGFGLGG